MSEQGTEVEKVLMKLRRKLRKERVALGQLNNSSSPSRTDRDRLLGEAVG